jgi:putative ABC transport system permease protein
LPRSAYPEAQASAFHDRLLARLSTLPGVEGAAATSGLPLSGRENLQQVTIEGRPRPRPGSEILTDYRVVTPGYFEVLGMRRLEGDGLREEEAPDTAPTLVINETMARAYWPGESPIGRRLKLTSYDRDAPWYTVVGVVNDTRYTALDSALRPQVYVHFHRDPAQQMWIVLRTGGDPLAFANAARNAVHEIDPNQPVGRVRAMAEVVAASVSDRRFSMFLLGMFATLALTLSVVGLYAVVSYSVSERIHEMGVRLALGAQPSNLLTMVLGEGLRLAAIGMAIGLGAALVMTRFLEALLFGVHARDAATFVAVPLVLTLAALFGCLVPAVRAMRIDPVVALRAE